MTTVPISAQGPSRASWQGTQIPATELASTAVMVSFLPVADMERHTNTLMVYTSTSHPREPLAAAAHCKLDHSDWFSTINSRRYLRLIEHLVHTWVSLSGPGAFHGIPRHLIKSYLKYSALSPRMPDGRILNVLSQDVHAKPWRKFSLMSLLVFYIYIYICKYLFQIRCSELFS